MNQTKSNLTVPPSTNSSEDTQILGRPTEEILRTINRRAEQRQRTISTAQLIRAYFADNPFHCQVVEVTLPRHDYPTFHFPWRELCDHLNSLGDASPKGKAWTIHSLSTFCAYWRLPVHQWLMGETVSLPTELCPDPEEQFGEEDDDGEF